MLVRRLRGAVGAERRCSASAPARRWPAPAPRPSSASRSPSWRPGSSASRSRQPTSSGRRCAAPPTGEADPAALAARLAAPTPTEWEELSADPLAVWTEQTLRAAHRRRGQAGPTAAVQAAATAAEKLARRDRRRRGGLPRRSCRTCCWPAHKARDRQGRPLFAFKLHQFIGKGDTVYITLEPPANALPHHPVPAQRTRQAPRDSRCSRWRSAASAARTSSSSTSSAAVRASVPAS